MSDTMDNDLERNSGSPSLLDAFEDSDFDVLWDSSLGKAAESEPEPTQQPESKLGGLDINWGTLGDSDLGMASLRHADNEKSGGSLFNNKQDSTHENRTNSESVESLASSDKIAAEDKPTTDAPDSAQDNLAGTDEMAGASQEAQSSTSGLGAKQTWHNRSEETAKNQDQETQQIQMTPEMIESLINLQKEGIQVQRANSAFKPEASLLIDTQDFEKPESTSDSVQNLLVADGVSLKAHGNDDEEETKVVTRSLEDIQRAVEDADRFERGEDNSELANHSDFDAAAPVPADREDLTTGREDLHDDAADKADDTDAKAARLVAQLDDTDAEVADDTDAKAADIVAKVADDIDAKAADIVAQLDDTDAKAANIVARLVETDEKSGKATKAEPKLDKSAAKAAEIVAMLVETDEKASKAAKAAQDKAAKDKAETAEQSDAATKDGEAAKDTESDTKPSKETESDDIIEDTDEILGEDEDSSPRVRVNNFEAIESFDKSCQDSCLSARARMGNFEPEGETITATHTLGHDVTYDDKDCENGVAPVERANPQRRKKMLLAAIVFTFAVLALVIAYAAYVKSLDPVVTYAQKAAFQIGNSTFDHYTMTQNGAFRAACSDARGVVLNRDNAIISEFWPSTAGCVGVRMSEDGRKVWFVDSRGVLSEVNLEKDVGFAAKEIAELTDYLDFGFEVNRGVVRWFALGEGGVVVRSLALSNGVVTEQALPAQAKLCSGLFANRYAYISGESIHLVEDGKTTAASLMTPKLGCSADSAIHCAYDGKGGWAVLCNNSIHQGHSGSDQAQVQLSNNTAIRSGAVAFNLLRHDKGTDFVTPKEWLHIDERGKTTTKEFKQKLGKSFALAYNGDEMPLRGIVDHRLKEITIDGEVVDNFPSTNLSHVGNAFVAGGNYVFSLFNDAKTHRSKAAVWDLLAGRLVDSKDFQGEIRRIHISNDGSKGFVVMHGEQDSIVWISFPTLNDLLTEQIQSGIERVDWSDDGNYAMLHFESGASRLYAFTDKGLVAKRDYDAETIVAIGHNDLIWRISGGNVVFERIESGELSVINEQLSTALRGQKIRAITLAQGSDDVLFWGEAGLWSYNVAKPQLNRVVDSPVAWVSPDRTGRWVATSAGLIDMTTLDIVPNVPLDPRSVVDWIGRSSYAVSQNRQTVFDFEQMKSYEVKSDQKLSFIGRAMDLHPVNNIVLGSRGDLTVLAEIVPNTATKESDVRASAIAVMGGNTVNAWCWRMAKDGTTQGDGNVCVSFAHKQDGAIVPIQTDNKQIANAMRKAFAPANVEAQMYAPYAFVDDVALSIETVPAESSIFFVVGEGTMPPQLASESGFLPAPVKTTLKRSDVNIGMAVTAPKYELRALSFTPNTAAKSIRVPLLLSAAQDIVIQGFDFDENNRPIDADLSDDIRFELASLLQAKRDDIAACLATTETKKFSLWLDENGILAAKAQADATPDACLTPVVTYIEEERKKGALPELNALSALELRLDITVP